jgi:peptidoglycan/xylan/chitin deacetylase (PgdA/CDA1 family)
MIGSGGGGGTPSPGSGGSGGTPGTGGARVDAAATGGNGGTVTTGGARVDAAAGGTGGTGGSGGTPGTGGGPRDMGAAGGAGGAVVPPTARPPDPSGPADLPRPAGAAANLKVLPWAGFRAAASYTFDDSLPSQLQHWPELKATGVPVTYYVTTGQGGRPPGYDTTLKEIAALGHELGNHTVSHCRFNLTDCSGPPLASIDAEIDQCTDYIRTRLGQPDVWTLAYPYGDTGYKPATQARFFLGRGVGGGMVGAADNTDPFNLPVVAAFGGENAAKFGADIDTARTQGRWVIFLFHSLEPGTGYAPVNIEAVTSSITHAKMRTDVWIDTLANVGAYWVASKLLTGAGPTWTWQLPAHFPRGKLLRVKIDGGTLKQGDTTLAWNGHGYYEVALDAGTLTWAP